MAVERRGRPARPLDAARLNDMALGYVARFATTRAKLAAYLARKLTERGWDDDGEPPVAAVVERLCAAGYVDDAAFARARGAALLRRGFGGRRVAQALGAAGVAPELAEEVAPDAAAERTAALALARKRRLGPYAHPAPDRAGRERHLAAMLRAGHRFATARAVIDAADVAAAERWAYGEADD